MRRFVRTIRALFAVKYAEMMEYRAEIYLWAVSMCLPFIMMGVWIAAAGRTDLGMSEAQIARYFLATFIVRNLTAVWVVHEFEVHVNEGRLTPLLLQPSNPVWRYVMTHLAEKAARLPFAAMIVVGACVLYPPLAWKPAVSDVVLGLAACVMAFALRFAIEYSISMSAFWTERAHSISAFAFLGMIFLSGLIAPLDLYPDAVAKIVWLTPFPYMVYFPVTILTGGHIDVLQGFLVMAGWTAGMIAVNAALWRLGLRHYSAMGA